MLFNMNMFSSFDLKLFYMNSWILFFYFLLNFEKSFKSAMFFISKQFLLKNMLKFLYEEKNNYIFLMNSKFLIFLFKSILLMNIFSLWFYSFSFTSMFMINFSFVMIMWSSSMMILLKKNSTFFIHLCPMGAPMYLSFMMVLIELVSILIQPVSLFLRLTINMISGHIMISLISSMMIMKAMIFIYMFPLLYMLVFLKMNICIIQSYIFTLLTIMYLKSNNKKF